MTSVLGVLLSEAMKYRTFRLTRDIQNPHYNRRCKYGIRAVKVLEAGSLVRASDIKPARGESYSSYQIGPDLSYADDVLEDEIARQDPRVELPATTLDEAAVQSYSNMDNFCQGVVRQLINEGRLDPVEAKELYDKYNR